MTEIKNRIAALDAFGRSIADRVNARIDEEELVGQSPATIRRVEELIREVQEAEDNPLGFNPGSGAEPMGEDEADEDGHGDAREIACAEEFEFAVMKGGIAARPFVTLARYTGRVGP